MELNFSSKSNISSSEFLFLSSSTKALLARFSANATFPRLPFEPISKEEYISLQNKVIERKVNNDFFDALNKYDVGELSEAGPAGCDSDKCLLPLAKPKD